MREVPLYRRGIRELVAPDALSVSPTVGLCLGTYGEPREAGFSYERP